jgi:tetratricopeptide (TPR) repeat protein
MPAPVEFRYRGFISYSHADARWAKWLHGRLESFRIDRDLVGRQTAAGLIPKTLGPIFRDRDDFTAGHSLSEQTLAALDASAALIVLCSLDAAKSHYVNEEVRLFKRRHPDRPIIPIILDGRSADPASECFPLALKFEVTPDGTITDQPADLLAAATGDGRDLALAKVVARMLGVPTDDVRKRQVSAQNWRLKVTAAVITVFAVLSLVTGFLFLEHQRQVTVEETRERERLAREEARDNQLKAEIVRSLLGISGAQAAPGAAKALSDAVADAQEGASKGDERLQKALDLLKANKPQDAEPLFRAVAEEKAARVRTDRARLERDSKVAAAAYRNLGAIAGLGDPKRAREAYAKALEYDGDDPEALYSYGYLNLLAGDLGTAQRTLARLLETATARGDQRGIYRAHLVQGRVMQDRGSLPSAFEYLEKSRGIALAESAAAKDDLEWQRDVSEAQIRMGEVLMAQGNLRAALDSSQAAHAIRERLATADPGNVGWQRDLSVSHNQIGDVLQAQDSLPAALDSYKAARAIIERLATADPGNVAWQRDLSISHSNIGEVLRAQGSLPAALDSSKAAHAIVERLATADPGNAGLHRDLSVSHGRIGDVLRDQRNLPAALEGYREGLAIVERLAAADPGNAAWQRDLSVSHSNIGDVLRAQDSLPAALDSYKAAHAIMERLAAADPGNAAWQRDLFVFHKQIGDVLRDQGNLPAALEGYRAGLAIMERLAAADPGNVGWQRDLSLSHNQIGDVLQAQDSLPAALDSYKAARAIIERLAAADPGNAAWQRDLAISFGRVAMVEARQGARDQALNRFRNARDIIVRLKAQSPDNAQLPKDLAWLENQISALSASR